MPALALLIGLGSITCWILVVVKIFQNESVGLGILAIICGLFAFIYGWTKSTQYGIQKIMMIWSALIVVGIILQLTMASHAQMQ